ncbi:SCO2524 family protein [Dactylosporangium sp. NPDC051541]|uniref:SCO2524 family protein n=1 Tax=Dactylosporangium sp. NPDC051541 TaxID=3363977 RepID=UPI0037927F38
MRIQPRRQLIETWRAVAEYSYPKQSWVWGGRVDRNSISDAEQLLCLLGPATSDDAFGIDQPDQTADDLAKALRQLGDNIEIPLKLLRIMRDYLTTYSDEEGRPTFSGGSYFTAVDGLQPVEDQRLIDVVDSYAISIRLSLAIIGFVRVYRRSIGRAEVLKEIEFVETQANRRLTAAMVGLLRGFAINVVDADVDEGKLLILTINQGSQPPSRIREAFRTGLADIRAGLRDMTIGIAISNELANTNKLFECGWSWGVTVESPPVETPVHSTILQPPGHAQQAPYLYFTVVALDAIQHLFSRRTRMLTLLDEEQNRLARALQVRFDLTLSYWSRLARFGDGRWPLEDIPWTTTDGSSSDYLSLLVASIVALDLTNNPTSEGDTARVAAVLQELAQRARITRRPTTAQDPAIRLHSPGYAFQLEGSELVGAGPRLQWLLTDFSTQLLRQILRTALLAGTVQTRADLTELADNVWEQHLRPRRLGGLWDRPEAIFPGLSASDPRPSWYYTERVVNCVVSAIALIRSDPLPSPELIEQAKHLLAEADHVFDRELIRVVDAGPSMHLELQDVEETLRRANELVARRPGTAKSLAEQVLVTLDRISAARLDGAEVF